MTPWIGIDPGAVRCGVVLRNGADCLGWRTIERDHAETEIGPGPLFWAEIERAIAFFQDAYARDGLPLPGIAIEGVRKPVGFIGKSGHREFAKPIDLIALGMTFGAIYHAHPEAIVIPPGNNGGGMLGSYPEQLITPAERRAGLNRPAGDKSLASHARSAWDVCHKATLVRRVAA